LLAVTYSALLSDRLQSIHESFVWEYTGSFDCWNAYNVPTNQHLTVTRTFVTPNNRLTIVGLRPTSAFSVFFTSSTIVDQGGRSLGSHSVAQPQWVSWVSGHPQKFKLGVSDTPKKVYGEYHAICCRPITSLAWCNLLPMDALYILTWISDIKG